jgi:hypothetical protein
MTEKADKGNSIVILHKPHCHEIVNDFIKSHDCTTLNQDSSYSFQKNIRHFPITNTNLISKMQMEIHKYTPYPTNFKRPHENT